MPRWAPNRMAALVNRCWAAIHALGVAPNYLVTLDVRGRRSGRMISLPLVMAVVGESATSCPCSELTSTGCGTSGPRVADRRAPVLKAYSRRAPSARPHLPISKDGRSPRSSRCLRGFQGSGSYREAHGMSDHIVDAMRAIHRAINSHMPPG
jgi:hypothetical protein